MHSRSSRVPYGLPWLCLNGHKHSITDYIRFNSLMYNRLLKFIDKNNLFNEFQFGLRNNHSTFMALIVLVENFVTALDNGNCVVGLFRFSKSIRYC